MDINMPVMGTRERINPNTFPSPFFFIDCFQQLIWNGFLSFLLSFLKMEWKQRRNFASNSRWRSAARVANPIDLISSVLLRMFFQRIGLEQFTQVKGMYISSSCLLLLLAFFLLLFFSSFPLPCWIFDFCLCFLLRFSPFGLLPPRSPRFPCSLFREII